MLKQYLVVAYAYLVKTGKYNLEPIKGDTRRVVPEEYRLAVAEYLASST